MRRKRHIAHATVTVMITIIKRANNETKLQSLLLTLPYSGEQLNNHEIGEMELLPNTSHKILTIENKPILVFSPYTHTPSHKNSNSITSHSHFSHFACLLYCLRPICWWEPYTFLLNSRIGNFYNNFIVAAIQSLRIFFVSFFTYSWALCYLQPNPLVLLQHSPSMLMSAAISLNLISLWNNAKINNKEKKNKNKLRCKVQDDWLSGMKENPSPKYSLETIIRESHCNRVQWAAHMLLCIYKCNCSATNCELASSETKIEEREKWTNRWNWPSQSIYSFSLETITMETKV